MISVSIKRVYLPPAPTDGQRILVDRLWPRGLTKAAADIDVWLKAVAPSTALRREFGHDPARWPEFEARYRAELATNPALGELETLARGRPTTLVYGARDEKHNQAVVLQAVLAGRPRQARTA